MKERKYKFVNKKNHVVYENVTEEELKVLNQSYRKEEYQSFEQYIHNQVICFTDIEGEDGSVDDMIKDQSNNIDDQVILPMFFEQLFAVLDPEEKELIKGYTIPELQIRLNMNYKMISRKRNKALKKMRNYLERMGFHGSRDVMND